MSAKVYLPVAASVVERTQESRDIFTLTFKFTDPAFKEAYGFTPGQFNMMYLFGVGEVPMSIVSDPDDNTVFAHTIRRVGRVTNALSQLDIGDEVGIRGPFGRGWPLEQAHGKNVLIITGGLGCAPSVSIINYIVKRKEQFGKLIILQGVKHSDDLIFREHYAKWAKLPDVQVLLAADVSKPNWPGFTGLITELIDQIQIDTQNTICMMCGPEAMMVAAVKRLEQEQLPGNVIYTNMERNMECAVGHCGHCQFGGQFVCKDGPVFCYPDIQSLLLKRGF
jgi:NAD(P)H-flavin reductase